jgi:insulysin
MERLNYFDIDLPINDKRDIMGINLVNGIKVVLVSDPDTKTSSCSVGVKAGYLQDTFEGTAHFLEHLLFMGSSKFPEQNMYHSYIQMCGGIDNAYTGDNITCYFIELETEFLEKGIEMLSWFFREPKLDMKHINSELEIINSEHQKNLLSDLWIMDDIFKKFFKKSKYTNFGTGNFESLKNISKEDIMKFYNTYYTTDNIYVCIVDIKPLKVIKNTYLKYFEDIPERIYTEKNNRFNKDKLPIIDENLIIFNSISQYIFLNYYLIINYEQNNQIDFQLINLISYLIGLEYNKSFCYYLKENNIANYIKTDIDYFYDLNCIISIYITLFKDDYNNIEVVSNYLNKLLTKLSNLTKTEFEKIYDNYRKINLLQSLYHSKLNASEVSNSIVENLMNSDFNLCVIRKNYVSEYKIEIYNRFNELLNDIEIKITSNINKKNKTKILETPHYKTKYFISNYEYNETKDSDNNIYDFNNITLFSDIIIKTDILKSDINKTTLPKLIFKNDFREIYLLEYNKYNKPIMNINIIRKNTKIIDKKNNVIVNIYIKLCMKILNYYLDTISSYKMYFSMNIYDEYLIMNFNGLDYVMNRFLNDIVNKISFYSIENNLVSKKYFEEIKHNIKEEILNLKFSSPYMLCLKYFSIILTSDFMPDDAIKFIDNLTFDLFMQELNKLLFFEKEYFVIIGNLNNCPKAFECNDYALKNALQFVDILTLNSLRYKSSSTELMNLYDKNNYENFILSINNNLYEELNYKLTKSQINPKEINNCLIDSYLIEKYKLELTNDIIKKEQLIEILKNKLIYGLLTELINEPLFDKIRTIDKLGYIVKSMLKYHTYLDNVIIFVCYVIQSNYSIDKIYNSVDNFNKSFYKDFKNNNKKFKKMFETLKKAKLIELNKLPTDIDEETLIYLTSIINKFGSFDYEKICIQILEKIEFSDLSNCIDNFFNFIVKNNRYYVILNKDDK